MNVKEMNRKWAALDIVHMFSPTHHQPRGVPQIRSRSAAATFVDVVVGYALGGIVARSSRRAEGCRRLAEGEPAE